MAILLAQGEVWSAYPGHGPSNTYLSRARGEDNCCLPDEPILIGHEKFQGGGRRWSGIARVGGGESEQGHSLKPLCKEDSGESMGACSGFGETEDAARL